MSNEVPTPESQPIVKEVVIAASVSRVWKAITDKNDMKQWYFDIPAFKLEVGFEFEFEGCNEDRVYRHLCIVKEVVENKKFSYSWRYDGYAGDSLVTFELFEEGDKTRLKLTHTGIENFESESPDFAKENFNQGWTDLIHVSIKEFIEKNVSE